MSKHLVAVYGTLMKGQPNHRWMMGAGGEFIEDTLTDGRMHMVSLGAFPAISFHNPSEDNLTQVKVELWQVDDDGLAHLDVLEGYPKFYNRQLVMVNGRQAWMYHLESRDAYLAPPIPHGDWNRYTEERTGLQMTEELVGNA